MLSFQNCSLPRLPLRRPTHASSVGSAMGWSRLEATSLSASPDRERVHEEVVAARRGEAGPGDVRGQHGRRRSSRSRTSVRRVAAREGPLSAADRDPKNPVPSPLSHAKT